jgi:enoyl-CoA hydratase/carnithine racemase
MKGGIEMYQFIQLQRVDEVGVITLNRPDRLNAWHAEMRQEVAEAFRAYNREPQIRAVIITGAGERAFSAGQDLAESEQFTPERAVQWMHEWRNMYGAMRDMDKPVVAALNGVAAGSAFQVALLCDIRVGHPGVRMGQPEINAGIASTMGPWLMWDMIGSSRTIELTLTGRLMDAAECHAIGIIHHLVPPEQVMEKALEVAKELAAKPPAAMKLNKRRFREVTQAGFEDAEAAGEIIQRESYATGEPQAMMRKFLEERRARKPAEPA